MKTVKKEMKMIYEALENEVSEENVNDAFDLFFEEVVKFFQPKSTRQYA